MLLQLIEMWDPLRFPCLVESLWGLHGLRGAQKMQLSWTSHISLSTLPAHKSGVAARIPPEAQVASTFRYSLLARLRAAVAALLNGLQNN